MSGSDGYSASQQIWGAYKEILDPSTTRLEDLGTKKLPIPFFDVDIISNVLAGASIILAQTPILIDVTGNVVIVGDIHGNLKDLVRIFRKNGSPEFTKYLFLGDYVDRGDFSIEVLTLLLSLLQIFPTNVFLLRGNHECEDANISYGFKDDINKYYPTLENFSLIKSVYDNMSLAANVNGSYFCVHGGITSRINSINMFKSIKKPINSSSPRSILSAAEDLMWSDPDPNVRFFKESTRGKGNCFGAFALKDFIKKNNLKCVIRAHTFIENGFQSYFDNLLYTVFSSSSYIDEIKNKLGYIKILEGKLITESLPSMPQLKRNNVEFKMGYTKKLLKCLRCKKISTSSVFCGTVLRRVGVVRKSQNNLSFNLNTTNMDQHEII